MFWNLENIKIVSSTHKNNKPFNKIENRPFYSFIIRIRGSVFYNFGNKTVLAQEGDLMFIPRGASYTYRAMSGNERYTIINFQCDFNGYAHPVRHSLADFYEAEYIQNHFADLWNFGTQAEKYKCVSLFYALLSYLSAIENVSYADKRKFGRIEPAIHYLKEHIYEHTLKISELHVLCGISDTYFRKIFVARFGMTPQAYIVSKRILHAKSIINSGDFTTVRDLAFSVGYNDPLYFGKAFKKFYGLSPSDAMKN